MYKLFVALSLAGCLAFTSVKAAQDSQATVTVFETDNAFSALFKSVWVQLVSINPRPQREAAAASPVATAGVRGADNADGMLKLYWKDDLAQDPGFQAELKRYNRGINEMNRGQPGAAIVSFDEFLANYHGSSLRPNALLGKGISLAATGETEQSMTVLEQFVDEFPKHPMSEQVVQIIDRLYDQETLSALQPVASGS